MIELINPYDGLWKKHLSIDDMDIILEIRTGGTHYGKLSILSTANNESLSANAGAAISRQAGTIAK